MKDWETFTKIEGSAKAEGGSAPDISRYILLKIVDNALAAVIVVMLVFFSVLGMFLATKETQINWALHAAELCLGVLLGLLKSQVSGKAQK